jgi:bifunctional non-homologous end joining protein LigD
VRPDGTTSFSAIQNASDTGKSDALVFLLVDLLYLDGETLGSAPLIDRKARLQRLLATKTVGQALSSQNVSNRTTS